MPLKPAPQITIWSAPRLHETTLSASWQVTPDDGDRYFDLLDEFGVVIGTGIADTADGDPSGRSMKAGYDPASADALGTVVISCSVRGGHEAVVEHAVHRVSYKNRSPNSVIPATDEYYFDHVEVAALFGECRPPRSARPGSGVATDEETSSNPEVIERSDSNGNGWVSEKEWLDAGLDFWQYEVFANWDTETHELSGRQIASGWWTDEQLRMHYPGGTITAESVRDEASYEEDIDQVWLVGPGSTRDTTLNTNWTVSPEVVYGPDGRRHYYLGSLYCRLNAAAGYTTEGGDLPHWAVRAELIRDTGIAGSGPNPPHLQGARLETLLWDWVDARYRYLPVDREPTAWAMRTLLESRRSDCVARSMREHCDSGEFHSSPHMRHPSQGGSRLVVCRGFV